MEPIFKIMRQEWMENAKFDLFKLIFREINLHSVDKWKIFVKSILVIYSEVYNSGTCTPIYFWAQIAQKPAISCIFM